MKLRVLRLRKRRCFAGRRSRVISRVMSVGMQFPWLFLPGWMYIPLPALPPASSFPGVHNRHFGFVWLARESWRCSVSPGTFQLFNCTRNLFKLSTRGGGRVQRACVSMFVRLDSSIQLYETERARHLLSCLRASNDNTVFWLHHLHLSWVTPRLSKLCGQSRQAGRQAVA